MKSQKYCTALFLLLSLMSSLLLSLLFEIMIQMGSSFIIAQSPNMPHTHSCLTLWCTYGTVDKKDEPSVKFIHFFFILNIYDENPSYRRRVQISTFVCAFLLYIIILWNIKLKHWRSPLKVYMFTYILVHGDIKFTKRNEIKSMIKSKCIQERMRLNTISI